MVTYKNGPKSFRAKEKLFGWWITRLNLKFNVKHLLSLAAPTLDWA